MNTTTQLSNMVNELVTELTKAGRKIGNKSEIINGKHVRLDMQVADSRGARAAYKPNWRKYWTVDGKRVKLADVANVVGN